ncbi:NAD(P)-dependent oxidoreductase [Nitratireductor aquimarinus]|nr:NAD(P)-dependent oxidoreductase [Nitratireductor pacificus]MBN7779380.1 NAD(P)-dependent oxidoreductase [Nitratireductor pacificus]MBN7788187.1 NAD(P)-dependent oxidoreductase [Nitratireductor aquimarinus]MBY6098234.1 NAD(P)-dependent oxidoreductase [Nitratireductor aquimarinus]
MNTAVQDNAAGNFLLIGLGAMGYGMGSSLLRAGLGVDGFDLNGDTQARFRAEAGRDRPLVVAAGEADGAILVVVNAAQTREALFGANGLADMLKPGAVVISCATIDPQQAIAFEKELAEKGILYLDAPISGGSARAAQGKLSVMASGSAEAFEKAQPALDAMAETVFRLGDRAGPGSAMKSVNQLLAGIHIAAAAEAFSFGIAQGLDADQIMQVIPACAGSSWMFENRGPYITDGDYRPHSAIDIFVKDLGIVTDAASGAKLDLPVSQAALERYRAASAEGMGREGDIALIKLYAAQSGIDLPPKRYDDK